MSNNNIYTIYIFRSEWDSFRGKPVAAHDEVAVSKGESAYAEEKTAIMAEYIGRTANGNPTFVLLKAKGLKRSRLNIHQIINRAVEEVEWHRHTFEGLAR